MWTVCGGGLLERGGVDDHAIYVDLGVDVDVVGVDVVVGNSLLQNWKPRFVITLNFCSDFEHFCQDFEVEVRRDFEAEVWSVFCC